jgi:hypothetical protein
MLLATGTTLNVQSFMGAIMAIGIAVANSILLVTFAERARHEGRPLLEAIREGAGGRLRAILMTAAAMIFGMAPMAIGFGEGGADCARRYRRPDRRHVHHFDRSAFDLRSLTAQGIRNFPIAQSDGPCEPIL